MARRAQFPPKRSANHAAQRFHRSEQAMGPHRRAWPPVGPKTGNDGEGHWRRT